MYFDSSHLPPKILILTASNLGIRLQCEETTFHYFFLIELLAIYVEERNNVIRNSTVA